MPVVPQRYGQRQVQQRALPGARRTAHETAESLGAGVSLERARTGETLAGIASNFAGVALNEYAAGIRQERERADNVALLEATNRLAQIEHDSLYGDQGLFNKTGKEVFGQPEEISRQFAATASEIEASLGTEEQRLRFREVRYRQGVQLQGQVARYVTSEIDKFESQQHNAYIENKRVAAINAVSLPGATADAPEALRAIELNLSEGLKEIQRYAVERGVPEELREQALAAYESSVHAGVIESMLSDPAKLSAAQQYFEEAQSVLAPEARDRIAKALSEGAIRQQTHEVVDLIVAEGGTLAEQRAKVRERTKGNAELRDSAMRMIEHEFTIKKTAERDAVEGIHHEFRNQLDQSGGDIDRLIDGNLTKWTQLSPEVASSLRSYAASLAKKQDVVTDQNAWHYLWSMATSSVPEERARFSSANLGAFMHLLSPSDFQEVVRMQGSARTSLSAADSARLSNAAQQNQIINDALLGMGLDPTPAQPGTKSFDPDMARRTGEFRRAVREAIQRWEAPILNSKGEVVRAARSATDDEVQSIVDHLRVQVAVQRPSGLGAWFGASTPVYSFELPGSVNVMDVNAIPMSERLKIEDAMRRKGITPTPEAILLTFNGLMAITRNRDSAEPVPAEE